MAVITAKLNKILAGSYGKISAEGTGYHLGYRNARSGGIRNGSKSCTRGNRPHGNTRTIGRHGICIRYHRDTHMGLPAHGIILTTGVNNGYICMAGRSRYVTGANSSRAKNYILNGRIKQYDKCYANRHEENRSDEV